MGLTRTSVTLGAVNLAVKPISLLKEIYVASVFGTSALMDSFSIALGIPNLIVALLGSPVAAAFTPIFMQERAQQRGTEFFRRVFGAVALVAFAASLAVVALRAPLSALAAPGLSGAGRMDVAGVLLLLSPYLTLQVLAEFQLDVLAALRRFVQGTAWRILIPLATMAALLLLGPTIRSMSIGLGVGAALVALTASVSLHRAGLRGIALPRRTRSMKQMERQVPVLMVSTVLLQLNLFIDRLMASTLPEGSVASLAYAYRLLMFVAIVFVSPFGQLLLTHFSEQCARGEWKGLVRTTNRAMRSAMLALLPICIFGISYAVDCVNFIYLRGEFSSESAVMTASAFAAYLPSILVLGTTLSLPRYFNATQRNRFMLLQTLIAVALNVLFNYILMQRWGHVGIAAATPLTIFIGRVILFFRMRSSVGQHAKLRGGYQLVTLAMGFLVLLLVRWAAMNVGTGLTPFWRLLVGGVVTLAVYLPAVAAFRRHDLFELVNALRTRG